MVSPPVWAKAGLLAERALRCDLFRWHFSPPRVTNPFMLFLHRLILMRFLLSHAMNLTECLDGIHHNVSFVEKVFVCRL